MEKMKIYSDTNMVHDFFVNHAKALKGRESFKMPEKQPTSLKRGNLEKDVEEAIKWVRRKQRQIQHINFCIRLERKS